MSKLPARIPPRDAFPNLLREIKSRIQQSQARAIFTVNAELIRLYWDVGRLIARRQREQGWGAAVIPRIARALHNELPEEKGFSERNIGRMIAFFRAYPRPRDFLPQTVAKLGPPTDSILWSIPWGHHAMLMEKVSGSVDRLWYMAQTLAHAGAATYFSL